VISPPGVVLCCAVHRRIWQACEKNAAAPGIDGRFMRHHLNRHTIATGHDTGPLRDGEFSSRTDRPMFPLPKHWTGKAIFGARVLIGFALPPLVFAHDVHPEMQAATAEESAFLVESDAAMTKMMNDMAAKPSGDVDRDFVAMMTPHHQGAIDMAVVELRYGKNEQLRRIAQEIIVDQTQEIATMKLAIGESATDMTPVPTQPLPSPVSRDHMDMPMHMSRPTK
jgi:hypothetical protein